MMIIVVLDIVSRFERGWSEDSKQRYQHDQSKAPDTMRGGRSLLKQESTMMIATFSDTTTTMMMILMMTTTTTSTISTVISPSMIHRRRYHSDRFRDTNTHSTYALSSQIGITFIVDTTTITYSVQRVHVVNKQ